MRGELVERGGEPQQLVRARGRRTATTRSTAGAPERERAGLVEQHRARLAEPLDHAAALDDHAARGRRARARRRARSARRGSAGTASRRRTPRARAPGRRDSAHASAGDDERERQEDGRVAVGEADERRPLAPRPPRTSRTSAAYALSAAARAARELERLAGVGRAAAHVRRRGGCVDRQRLAGERRLVDDRLARSTTTPSTGTTSPARTTTTSPGHDRLDRHLLDRVPSGGGGAPSAAPARRAGRQLAARARPAAHSSSAFPPASISATTAPASVLAERERAGHRDQRDRVDADVAARASVAGDRPRRAARARRRSPRPRRVAGVPARRRGAAARPPTIAASADAGGVLAPACQEQASARYQVLARAALRPGRTRTRASTATQPSGRPTTGFRSSSAISGMVVREPGEPKQEIGERGGVGRRRAAEAARRGGPPCRRRRARRRRRRSAARSGTARRRSARRRRRRGRRRRAGRRPDPGRRRRAARRRP